MIIISEQDNEKEIAVGCGGRFEIEMEQTGGTGYAWHITDLNNDYIRLLGEETRPMSEGAVGRPVKKIWRFETLKSGTTHIVMKNYRVWEGADRAIGTFSVTLLIR
ncbi:MAG: protease inhibitor I42 family protein [Nitrospirota bacterium]